MDSEEKALILQERLYDKNVTGYTNVMGEFISCEYESDDSSDDDDFADLTPEELQEMSKHKELLNKLDTLVERQAASSPKTTCVEEQSELLQARSKLIEWIFRDE